MSEFLHSITNIQVPFNMIVLVVLIGSTAGVIGTIAKQLRRYACHRQELEFKREMLERGMSAGEIEQVIRAQGPTSKAESCSSH
jgi:hypothetical protein